MKKLLVIGLFSLIMGGCSEEKEKTDYQPEPEYITVGLNIDSEIEIEESPLASISNADIYAINIYQKNTNTNQYVAYAYGIFDNIDNLSAKLELGGQYKIKASLFVGGFSKLDHLNVDHYGKVSTPMNAFAYSKESLIYELDYPVYHLDNSVISYMYPNMDSYHGQVVDYTPSESDNNISLYLYRGAFGLEIKVEGMTEGKLSVRLYDGKSYNYRFPEFDIVYPSAGSSGIYTFKSPFEITPQTAENYRESLNVTINYTDSKSNTTALIDETMSFARNVRKTINLKLKKDPSSEFTPGLSVSKEESIMKDEELSFECTL